MKHLILTLALSFAILSGVCACSMQPDPSAAPYQSGQTTRPN